MSEAQFPDEHQDGEFVRQDSAFRQWVRADGSTEFAPAAGRYVLYVSLACPWAHRTIIARKLKGLESVLGMVVVDPIRDERGWRFRDGIGQTTDPITGFSFLKEAYVATDASFEGRVTVPVLWDKESERIVNNESSELLRMLNAEFADFAEISDDLYPPDLRDAIDAVNARVYEDVNNGVYRSGFATTQQAYERAVKALFGRLDELERTLGEQRYLVADRITEADIRLFTTLVRFDPVYVGHFKCNVRRIADYPNLSGYLRDLYQTEGFGDTVDFDHIKRHYYVTHDSLNPSGIVPVGPKMDLTAPHGRG